MGRHMYDLCKDMNMGMDMDMGGASQRGHKNKATFEDRRGTAEHWAGEEANDSSARLPIQLQLDCLCLDLQL